MAGDQFKTTFHQDGTISFWDVYSQCWCRLQHDALSDRILASLSPKERKRILKYQSKSKRLKNG